MYAVGEFVVKANTGICRIDEIVMRRLSEEADEKAYYCLAPLGDNRAKVFVPVESDKSNIRRAMTETEAKQLIDDIPSIESRRIDSDRFREQEYKTVMKSNDPVAFVSIIKNLYIRNKQREHNGKKVTALDDRYFRMAEDALYTEIVHVIDIAREDITRLIVDSIGQI